jgi:hypothetical protein
VKRCIGIAIAALLAAGCKAPPTRTAPPASSPARPSQLVEQWAAAVAEDARRSDHENSAQVRAQLADDANRNAQACLDQSPQADACLYYHGIALGLSARAHPLHAADSLESMLAALAAAEAANPALDQAGPARVQALVLIKAPAWPLGPGDPEAGLAAARRAVSLQPLYPPNELALAEALVKNGDAAGARQTYARARELIRALPPSADRDDWLRQADQALAAGSPP